MAQLFTVESKVCTACGEEKPLTEFHKSPNCEDGRHPKCGPCKNALAAGYYKRWTPEQRMKHRARVLRTRYGITPEMLDQLYELQEGCCAICGTHADKPARSEKGRARYTLHVDHNHTTGRVRGLLCMNCNGGLGQFKERLDLLVKASAYMAGDDL